MYAEARKENPDVKPPEKIYLEEGPIQMRSDATAMAVHYGPPPEVSTADSEVGWREALGKLVALVERGISSV